MRMAFAHEAVLDMPVDADVNALGAAITVALCGHWEHEPPCPLAPHHSHAVRAQGVVHLRTLFAADPAEEQNVRHRIRAALAWGGLQGPGDSPTHWRLRSSRTSDVKDEEQDHAQRLICS